jgi:hypothetical protein
MSLMKIRGIGKEKAAGYKVVKRPRRKIRGRKNR